jgi:hypothetical protein
MTIESAPNASNATSKNQSQTLTLAQNPQPPSLEFENHKESLEAQLDQTLPVKRRRLNHSDEYCDQLESAMLKKIENELELIKVEVVSAVLPRPFALSRFLSFIK